MSFTRQHAALLAFAMAAVCVLGARACLQSITIDEATSFLMFANAPWPAHWWPSSGNHVLNSLLMRLTASIFGVSEPAVRAPAVLGGVLYIASAVYLCALVTNRKLLQLALFICLVYNPFVLDYLIAARGYGLAAGFLLAAIAVIASVMLAEDIPGKESLQAKCAWISSLLALSFTANFSFAVADGITMLCFFVWLMRRGRPARLAAWCFLPGLAIAAAICGSTLWRWPRGELYFGSESVWRMWADIMQASFDELNPNVVNPILIRWGTHIAPALPYALVAATLLLAASITLDRRRSSEPHRLIPFIGLLAGAAGITFLIHWAAFHTVHIPLPKDRTALYFVPLCTLAYGGALAVKFRMPKVAALFPMAILVVSALYFVGCLRFGYFREWRFDIDTKRLYWMLEDLHRRYGLSRFGVDWRYHVALNFYREVYLNYSLKEYEGSESDRLPTDRDAYAIYLPTSEEFIKEQRLQVIYHNDESGSGIAVRAGLTAAGPTSRPGEDPNSFARTMPAPDLPRAR